jgi:uncharacterized protein (DUF1330 family)
MTKPAYMIFGLDVHDAEKFGQYAQGTLPLLEKYGVQVFSARNDVETLKGSWSRQRVTILKYPSLAAAKEFWNLEEYAPLKALRESASDADIMLIEGMTDDDPDNAPDDLDNCHYVFGQNDMLNADWIPEYQANVGPVAAKWGLSMLASGDGFEVLDGNFPRQTMVLLQFPSEDAFRGFWWDDDYLHIKKLREDNTVADSIAFAGGFDAG